MKAGPAKPGLRFKVKLMTTDKIIMPADRAWFAQRIKDKGLTVRGLAKLLNTNASNMSRILRGRQPLRIERAIPLAQVLDVPLDMVLSKTGLSIPTCIIPIIGTVDRSLRITNNQPKISLPPIPSFPDLPLDAVSVVCTDAASPMAGWTFCYVPTDKVEASAIGRLCVVRLADGDEMIRFVRPSLQLGRFDLLSISQKRHFPAVSITAATPVLHIRP